MIGIKKVGIDCDGVLCDFPARFRDLLNSLFNLNLPSNYTPTDWEWSDTNLAPNMIPDAWKVIVATMNFWEGSIPMPGIVTLAPWFWEHADKDYEVYFITSRIETAGTSTRKQTVNWLREYLGYPKQDINVIVTSSGTIKKRVLEALHIDYFIDDHLDTVQATNEVEFCRSYLLDQSWNRKNRGNNIKVVTSVYDYLEKVETNN